MAVRLTVRFACRHGSRSPEDVTGCFGRLRRNVAPRRYALLLAAFRAARGRLLDELTVMLIKLSAKIVWRSEERLEETRIDRRDQSTTLIATLAEMLEVIACKGQSTKKLARLEAIVAANGGCEVLQKACEKHTNRSSNPWQPFAHQAFSPYRQELLLLGRTLPLNAARPSAKNLLEAVVNVVTLKSSIRIWTVPRRLPAPMALVQARCSRLNKLNRHYTGHCRRKDSTLR